VCPSCGSVHYENPRVIVGCFAHWKDRVVFCRRAIPPERDMWMIPSGYLELGETLQEAAVRELAEETGVRADPNALDLYAVWSMVRLGQVGVSFHVALPAEPELRPGSESLSVGLLGEPEVPFPELAWRDSMEEPIRRFFAQLRTGEFNIHLRQLASDPATGAPCREYKPSR